MWGIISAVGLGHGSEASCYSKTFSVLLTFNAQFVQSNLKSFCVSLPFSSASSTAEHSLSLIPEFPVTIIHDQVIKADLISSQQELFSSRRDEYLLHSNSLDLSHA